MWTRDKSEWMYAMMGKGFWIRNARGSGPDLVVWYRVGSC